MICRPIVFAAVFWLAAVGSFPRSVDAAPRSDGQLTIEIVDGEMGQPIAARMHLKNSRGRPLTLRIPNTAEFGGHFHIDGRLTLPLRVGQYTFELEAGPEYRTQSGHFEIQRDADDSKRIEMKRFADLAKEGWYAGDVDVERPEKDLPLIMRAEGLSTIPGDGARSLVKTATSGERLLFNLPELPDATRNTRAHSSLAAIDEAGARDGRIISRSAYAWELPVWLAGGKLDAVCLINHHALRDNVLDHEKDGRPRDQSLFPGRTGNGRWAEAVYYHALNCGLRIAPAAGSGSGTNDSPVGTNRVYVYCGDEFSSDRWWEGLEAGRVFVTNGPLLRPTVEGRPPGHVFRFDEGGSLMLDIGLELATRVPVEYLQIVKNGLVESEVRLAEWAKQDGRLPPIQFDDSGWFLVRVITTNQRVYQYASSGPYYVEQGGRPRVSRGSVQFFLDWIEAAKLRIGDLPALNDDARQALLAEQESARQFFEERLGAATVE